MFKTSLKFKQNENKLILEGRKVEAVCVGWSREGDCPVPADTGVSEGIHGSMPQLETGLSLPPPSPLALSPPNSKILCQLTSVI